MKKMNLKKGITILGLSACFFGAALLGNKTSAHAIEQGTVTVGVTKQASFASDGTKIYSITLPNDGSFYKLSYTYKAESTEYSQVGYQLYLNEDVVKRGEMNNDWKQVNRGSVNWGRLEGGKTYNLQLEYDGEVKNDVIEFTVESYTKDDYADKAAGAFNLTLDKTTVGVANANTEDNFGDVDVFKFTTDGTAGYYSYELKNYQDATNNSEECLIESWVYSDEYLTDEVAYVGICNGKHEVKDLKKLEKNHTYYIKMEFSSLDLYKTSAYNVCVKKYAVDDHGDATTDLTTISVGKHVKGNIVHYDDVDYFKFKTDKSNAFYNVSLKITGVSEEDDNNDNIKLTIFSDKEMTDLVRGNGWWDTCVMAGRKNAGKLNYYKNLKRNTTYYVKIERDNGKEFLVDNYDFIINKVADDVEDEVSKATALTLNKAVTKKLQNDLDVDVYKFTTNNYLDYDLSFKNTSKNTLVVNVFKDKQLTKSVFKNELWVDSKKALESKKGAMNLVANRTYYVVVSGVSAEANASYTLSVNVKAPSNKVAAANTKKKKGVKVTWSKINKASGYIVERYTKKDGWKAVKTLNNKTTSWTDTTVKKGQTYNYRIRAYANVKKGGKTVKYYSNYSAVKSIKIK